MRYVYAVILTPHSITCALLCFRVSELFDILVEYPDSEPALQDLKLCLEKVNKRAGLIASLKSE